MRSERSKMNKGDTVVVIRSPYRSVKNGTVSTIKESFKHYYGTKDEVFTLEGIPELYFKEHEIAKIIKPEKTDEDISPTS